MTDREAQELIRMAEANWHMDLGPARAMWRTELMMHNVDSAFQAMAEVAKHKQHKLNLADYVEAIEALEARAKRKAAEERRAEMDARAMAEGKRGIACPEWVHVWVWDRNRTLVLWERGRVPHKDRAFKSLPQMGDWADPDNRLTMTEYETLREEWVAAGSPKEKLRQLLEAA